MPKSALVVVDMLNPYDHPDADALIESVKTVVDPISQLIAQARAQETDVIYVNDNFGDWSASARSVTDAALNGRARELVEPIVPEDGTPFVMKARHTIFYETPLEYLLGQEDIDRVVLVGQVTEQCILYSALDAYVRHFDVVVPTDAVAHIHSDLAEAAIEMMRRNMSAQTAPSADIEL
jgi:nicotinamidase-related amidase